MTDIFSLGCIHQKSIQVSTKSQRSLRCNFLLTRHIVLLLTANSVLANIHCLSVKILNTTRDHTISHQSFLQEEQHARIEESKMCSLLKRCLPSMKQSSVEPISHRVRYLPSHYCSSLQHCISMRTSERLGHGESRHDRFEISIKCNSL